MQLGFKLRSGCRINTAPLYFFLGNLAFLDASYSFIVAPRMLVDFLSEKKVISYRGCITQLFFLHFLGGGEGLLLVVMAFDRYIAICRPLRYSTVMNPRTCYALLLALWLGGFVHSIIQVALILRLPFCGPNRLDNFFCDVPQVIKLACTDTFVVELLMVFNSGLLTLLCFLGLLASYAVILCRVSGSASEGKSKALSTCTTHVIIILLMFGCNSSPTQGYLPSAPLYTCQPKYVTPQLPSLVPRTDRVLPSFHCIQEPPKPSPCLFLCSLISTACSSASLCSHTELCLTPQLCDCTHSSSARNARHLNIFSANYSTFQCPAQWCFC